MSQHLQFRDGPSDTYNFPVQDSPTVGRIIPQSSAGSPQGSPSSLSDTGYRTHHKAIPSPLQTSTSANPNHATTTPTKSGFSRPSVEEQSRTVETVRYTSRRGADEPRSPKERLDDLLASEKSFYDSEDAPASPTSSGGRPRPAQAPTLSNASSRSVSDPTSAAKLGGRATAVTPPHMAAVPEHRATMARGVPRTSSIDSAISSMHSHKTSQDAQARGESPDIANLIQTAGSAEAVIQYLLKEKQSQTAQNTQLWRLVDKQRAMILGLNKDLERALKDKERYRKKMKESLQAITAGEPGKGTVAESSAGKSSPSPRSPEGPKGGNVEALVSAGLRESHEGNDEPEHSPIDVALAPYPVTPPANPATALNPTLPNMVDAEHKMPDPSSHALNNYNADAQPQGFGSGQQQRKSPEMGREMPYNASVPPSRSLPARPPPKADTKAGPSSMQAPTLNVVSASPAKDQGRANMPPPRKPPPAPLNLGKQPNTSSHLHQADSGDELDSDYDDLLEVDEIPIFSDRGRRKTREEDDREREIAAMRDAEARSLSKKSKSRPSTSTNKDKPPQEPLPAVRQAVQISPPDMRERHLSPPDSNAGSLAGILNSSGSSEVQQEAITRTFISPPPMSPGLPSSPRPMGGMHTPLPRNPRDGDSQTSSMASPPLSPRGVGAFPSMPLSPRAPRQPIPLPPNTPMSMASPGMLSKFGQMELVSPKPLQISRLAVEEQDPPLRETRYDSIESSDSVEIFRGFVTDEYPDLLLPPNALPSIDVRVASSRLKPSRVSMMFPSKGDEDPVFTLAVFGRSNGQELWRVEKDSTSLHQLDQELKKSNAFSSVRLPEKSLFNGHAPAKIDARRTALDKYVDDIMNTPMDTARALHICQYLSTNTLEPNSTDSLAHTDAKSESPTKLGPGGRPVKNGYLTKRGKNFGGWKARFFVLDGPVLKYYEAPGGAHLGAIKLQSAKIGKQQQHQQDSQADDADNQYRHAFLILEPKRKDSSSLVRHVLCAESDKERDEWVEALVQYVEYQDSDDEGSETVHHARNDSATSSHTTGSTSKKKHVQGKGQTIAEADDELLRAMPYEATVAGQVPRGVHPRRKTNETPPPVYDEKDDPRYRSNDTPSPPSQGHEKDFSGQMPHPQSAIAISAPKNLTVIQDASHWGHKQTTLAPIDDKKTQKKRSFFGFGSKPRPSSESQDHIETSNLSQLSYEQHGPIRAVFGAPLAEAVKYSHPADVNVELPAVVYRCVEYLDNKNASSEEGIFRLSGSNVVIKALRERFNTEGDVNLITDEQYYDIHAVASLLKLYLRELPTTILTRELHLDFLSVTEIHDVNDKVAALNGLVHKLPKANNTLLRYLSAFLINIINHSDVNKMTVRNVGIVFSPTLNIPAPVLALFLQKYDGIFESEPQQFDHQQVEVTLTAPPLTPEDIRSPRKQHFQDLPTPSYNQASFPRGPPPSFPLPAQPNKSTYDTGFTPSSRPTKARPEYGATGQTVGGPAYDQYSNGNAAYSRQYGNETNLNPNGQSSKQKRRESSLLGMNMGGQKKPNQDRLRNNH
ncbi:Rho GTPase activating protein [Pseudogymnoascus australis]